MTMLLCGAASKTFKVMPGPGDDANPKQAFRTSDVSPGESQMYPSEGRWGESDLWAERRDGYGIFPCGPTGGTWPASLTIRRERFEGIGEFTALSRHKMTYKSV